MNTLRVKLKGFTVLELLAGMIVSAIVLATLFTAYNIVSKQAINYRERSAAFVARSQLHSLLTRDVLRADSSFHSGEENFQCLFRGQTVVYETYDTCVIRKWNDRADTFFTGQRTEEYFISHERDQH